MSVLCFKNRRHRKLFAFALCLVSYAQLGADAVKDSYPLDLLSKPLSFHELSAKYSKPEKFAHPSSDLKDANAMSDDEIPQHTFRPVKDLDREGKGLRISDLVEQSKDSNLQILLSKIQKSKTIPDLVKSHQHLFKPASNLDQIAAQESLVLSQDSVGEDIKITAEKFEKSFDMVLGDQLKLKEHKIFVGLGEQVPLSIKIEEGGALEAMSYYIEDNPQDPILTGDNDGNHILFSGKKEGLTKAVFHYKGSFHHLYIQVGEQEEAQDLEIPSTLMTFNNLNKRYNETLTLIDKNSLNKMQESDKTLFAEMEEEDHAKNKMNLLAYQPQKLSIESSEEPRFGVDPDYSIETRKVSFQILEAISSEYTGKIYPIAGIKMHFVGTDFTVNSDNLGKIEDIEIPRGSNFLVRLEDPTKKFHKSVLEIHSADIEDGKVYPLHMMKIQRHSTYLQISGSSDFENSSSICGTVLEDQRTEGKIIEGQAGPDKAPLSGVQVEINWKGANPIYVNQYGLLDPMLQKTSSTGRFCVFGLEPGPFAFYFNRLEEDESGEKVSKKSLPHPVNLFAGAHLEYSFALGETNLVETVTAALTANDLQEEMESFENPPLVPLGSNENWEYDEQSQSSAQELTFYNSRAYYMSQDPMLEDTLYKVDLDTNLVEGGEIVTPVFPRGFLRDLAFESNIERIEPNGSVYIDHGESSEDFRKSMDIRLLDKDGESVGEKVRTQNSGDEVFFNVPPGVYAVVVKNSEGAIVDFDTVLVYTGTLSYIHSGAPLQRYPTSSN